MLTHPRVQKHHWTISIPKFTDIDGFKTTIWRATYPKQPEPPRGDIKSRVMPGSVRNAGRIWACTPQNCPTTNYSYSL